MGRVTEKGLPPIGHTMWGHPELPPWVEGFREGQPAVIQEVERKFDAGYRVVFLDAPTGAGKTLIAEAVRRRLRQNMSTEAIYICTTKTLQEQFIADFPYAKLIKGRNNYPTLDRPDLFRRGGERAISAADCTKTKMKVPACAQCEMATPDLNIDHEIDHDWKGKEFLHCQFCHPWQHCPYEEAKTEARFANLAVANTSYWLTEVNGPGRFSKKFPLVIIDEADSLEFELMRYVEFQLSERMMRRLEIHPPERKTVASTWIDWANVVALPALEKHAKELDGIAEFTKDVGDRRQAKRVHSLHQRLAHIAPKLAEDWVYDGYDRDQVIFRPVRIDREAETMLWQHGTRFLLMSATIISPDQMADDLGLERSSWSAVRFPEAFDPNRFPIFIEPRANMVAKTKEQEWPKMAAAVKDVLDRHPTERVLVHTVSYDLTRYLDERVAPFRTMAYYNARDRDSMLSKFRQQENAVLLAPSFERGIDLPDDDCRVVVVAKIPYPYLGDKQVSARLHSEGGQGWYSMQTVRSLVQMTGRAMRHTEDHCTIYILDQQFLANIWKKNREFLPQWWRNAIVWHPERRKATVGQSGG